MKHIPKLQFLRKRYRITPGDNSNCSSRRRVIEVTSYAEVDSTPPARDQAHRAFSNLFIETEIIKPYQAILCRRRPRSEKETFPLMLHLMAVHGRTLKEASYETDRSKFIGRGRTTVSPLAMDTPGFLSNSEGSVLDPVVSIRSRLELAPGDSAVIDYVTGTCENRESAQRIIEKYRDKNLSDRIFNLAGLKARLPCSRLSS